MSQAMQSTLVDTVDEPCDLCKGDGLNCWDECPEGFRYE